MYDPQLSQIIAEAISRLHQEMAQTAPYMARRLSDWTQQLSGSGQPADYFKHPLAFPSLLLPWWLEKSISNDPDVTFQSELAYSTINGYYYIRLIDNLMDGHATVELELLPALGLFHTQFQLVYQRYFTVDHPFWELFTTIWFHSAEATMKDATLVEIDATLFEQVAAQKVCAVKIPLAAVCYRYDRPELIESWSRLVDLLGCWHQFLNDLLGWHRDHIRQTHTYFLSEAERRREADEPVVSWVAREGFNWATAKLETWMLSLQDLAVNLPSPELETYLNTRNLMLQQQKEEIAEGLQSLAKLVNLSELRQ